jgi:hypothetical protein
MASSSWSKLESHLQKCNLLGLSFWFNNKAVTSNAKMQYIKEKAMIRLATEEWEMNDN